MITSQGMLGYGLPSHGKQRVYVGDLKRNRRVQRRLPDVDHPVRIDDHRRNAFLSWPMREKKLMEKERKQYRTPQAARD